MKCVVALALALTAHDDAGGSDGALGKAVGFSAGAVALGAAFL